MNCLQSLTCAQDHFVTLNRTDHIDESKVLMRIQYHHPLYGPDAPAAQARVGELNGRRRTHLCGAWCFNGFHEDGVNSALRVCEHFGMGLDD